MFPESLHEAADGCDERETPNQQFLGPHASLMCIHSQPFPPAGAASLVIIDLVDSQAGAFRLSVRPLDNFEQIATSVDDAASRYKIKPTIGSLCAGSVRFQNSYSQDESIEGRLSRVLRPTSGDCPWEYPFWKRDDPMEMNRNMRSHSRKCILATLATAFLLISIGCKRPAETNGPVGALTVAAPSSNAGVKRYSLNGMVLGKSEQGQELTVKHGVIPGFMPAMTMIYKVKDPAVLKNLEPGDQISAVILDSSSNDNYLLDEIVTTDASRRNLPPEMLPAHALLPGEKVPEMPLVNQDGKTIHLRDYRGKAMLITFIYTRCPLPNACPLITSHFLKVHELLAKDAKAYGASHLLSISLDPAYDSPPVLRQFGLAYLDDRASDFEHWEFAVTTPGDLKKLATAFGLEYTEEDNQITHTMRTTLIGANNKVVQTWYGSGWEPEEVANAIKAEANKAAR